MSDPEIDRIYILQCQPGDILVLHVARALNIETAARIREHMTGIAPPGVKCIVLDADMSLRVLRGEADGGSLPAEEVA